MCRIGCQIDAFMWIRLEIKQQVWIFGRGDEFILPATDHENRGGRRFCKVFCVYGFVGLFLFKEGRQIAAL